MPYSYTLTATIPASPEEIYDAWLDSLGHSEMTGSPATMSDRVGAEVSAWEGYISGRNLELVPGERIVQSWRTSEFGDEHEDSVITVILEPVEGGTLLTLEHSNVPDEQKSYEEGGWESNYFEPMIAYFSELEEEAEEPEAEQALPQTVARRTARKRGGESGVKKSPGKPAKRRAASAGKAKRAAAAKPSKTPAPRAKAAVKKAKAKARPAKSRAGKTSARKKPSRRKRK